MVIIYKRWKEIIFHAESPCNLHAKGLSWNFSWLLPVTLLRVYHDKKPILNKGHESISLWATLSTAFIFLSWCCFMLYNNKSLLCQTLMIDDMLIHKRGRKHNRQAVNWICQRREKEVFIQLQLCLSKQTVDRHKLVNSLSATVGKLFGKLETSL